MQFNSTAAALALALGASAAPSPFHHAKHSNVGPGGMVPVDMPPSGVAPSGTAPSGGLPVASSTAVALSYKISNSTSSAATGTTSAASLSDSTAESGGSLPASSGTSVLDAVQTIAAGESFDGGMVMFDRGTSCTGQEEGGDSDAVFELEDGASLSNVIIGPNQIEGVHCYVCAKLPL